MKSLFQEKFILIKIGNNFWIDYNQDNYLSYFSQLLNSYLLF